MDKLIEDEMATKKKIQSGSSGATSHRASPAGKKLKMRKTTERSDESEASPGGRTSRRVLKSKAVEGSMRKSASGIGEGKRQDVQRKRALSPRAKVGRAGILASMDFPRSSSTNKASTKRSSEPSKVRANTSRPNKADTNVRAKTSSRPGRTANAKSHEATRKSAESTISKKSTSKSSAESQQRKRDLNGSDTSNSRLNGYSARVFDSQGDMREQQARGQSEGNNRTPEDQRLQVANSMSNEHESDDPENEDGHKSLKKGKSRRKQSHLLAENGPRS
jgi:hypothetical protein